MRVAKNTIVTVSCRVTDMTGKELLLISEKTLSYLHGGYDNVLPQIEEALNAKAVGDTVEVMLAPEDAFGEYDVHLVHSEPRTLFPDEVAVGMEFTGGRLPIFDDEELQYRVIDIDREFVTVDGNHPFAGKTIRVECIVLDIRRASEAEIRAGKPPA